MAALSGAITTSPPPRPSLVANLMLLEEPDCFPKDCPTDLLAPNELGLRTETLPHRPTVGDDLVLDSPRQERRRLALLGVSMGATGRFLLDSSCRVKLGYLFRELN